MWRIEKIIFGLCMSVSGGIIVKLIEWIWPAAPSIMFIIYNVAITVVTIAFGIALVYTLWNTLRSGWTLKYRDQRQNVWRKLRQWPTGKRDVFTAMAITWSIAIVVSSGAFAVSVPSGRFTEQELKGTALTILLLAMTPILLLIYWHFFEFVRDVWRKWRTETRNGRIKIAATAASFILFIALMIWGDMSGWEDRTWFAN